MDFASYLKKVGQNIRRARWRAGMTQQEVASAGITYRYYQEIERGQTNPTLKLLYDLAEILDVRVADLVEVGEKKPPIKLADVTAAPPPRGRKPKAKRSPARS